MKKNSKGKCGFTLIELLVVIAIMAILTGIIMVNLQSSKAKARDGKRVSDIAQIQLALEQYFDKCHIYPAGIINTPQTDCTAKPLGVTMGTFISTIPKDPSTGNNYDYTPSIDRYDYFLHAKFELAGNPAVKDGLAATPTGSNWSNTAISCSNANTSKEYCMGPK